MIPRKRLGARRAAAIVLATSVLSACGGGGGGESDAAAAADADASASAEASAEAAAAAAAAKEAKKKAKQKAEWERCVGATEGLLGALQQIDSRLSVGMNADELGDRVGDAQFAYDRINYKKMATKCTMNAGIALEDGLNQYIDSVNKWNECIEDYNCSVEGAVLSGLRKHWSEATERIKHVEKILRSSNAYAKQEDLI